ncbi:hypothetical protein Vadar_027100 [Vaccinium darrowii]|uniref:Uncharacterized protein n=1 Tax=Vaccinium darrowii TaxID=229202 RepID=A0ACB7ZE22_9ERIC|nr:hypothetical protein Vadar_027100 [Vaccinium darrowii]
MIHLQVSDQLNQLYLKFLKRNPGYDGKVSLFGHSLGSVLTYDIICHQENLSSPFPMEWMYKEQHPMNEESSFPTLNNQSSEYNSKSSQNNNVVSINNQTKGIVGPSEEGNAGGRTTFLVPEMEDSSVPAGFSVPLDFDEPSAMEVESKQPDAISSLGKDDNEQVFDSRDMLSCKTEYFNEASNVNNQVPAGSVENLSCSGSENDKDKAIELLREEEIDCLKARIAELETLCGGAGVEVVSTTTANQPVSGKLPCGQNDTLNCRTPCIKYTKLEFKVDTFFAVGSPLGVFLALRNTCIGIGKGQEYWEEENVSEEMPACRQMFNIFHPFDPVAYRLEPLICKEYISKRPVIVPYHRGGKRLHIGLQEFAEDFALRSQAIMDQLGSVRVKLLTLCQSRDKDNLDEASEDNLDKLERSYGSIMMERLTGSEDGRVDHMLQHKTFQHPYISAIGSHTNYWRDDDTALFILKHLYRDIPKEPELLAGKKSGSKKNDNGSEGCKEVHEKGLMISSLLLSSKFDRLKRKIDMQLTCFVEVYLFLVHTVYKKHYRRVIWMESWWVIDTL